MVENIAVVPAGACKLLWMVNGFTVNYGAIIVVTGSHLFRSRARRNAVDHDANWVPAGSQPRIIESNMGGMLLGKVEPDKNRGGVYRHFSTDEAVAFYE